MNITFLSDEASWKNEAIGALVKKLRKRRHKVTFLHKSAKVPRGEILFILGYFQIIPTRILAQNSHNIVVHESALPKGRGWSPLTWQVLEGKNSIPLALFEAVEKVDAGAIYLTDRVKLKGHELLPEIQQLVAPRIVRLCETFIAKYPSVLRSSRPQRGEATYYPKRTSKDSRLELSRSLAQQFNLLRTVHNEKYPAYFHYRGCTYILSIKKSDA